jgi:hypothetical protein
MNGCNKQVSQFGLQIRINSLPLDKMLKVAGTAIQRIITMSSGAVLEEAKILAITEIVLNLMEQNGH